MILAFMVVDSSALLAEWFVVVSFTSHKFEIIVYYIL